jgi:hypothetical protein
LQSLTATMLIALFIGGETIMKWGRGEGFTLLFMAWSTSRVGWRELVLVYSALAFAGESSVDGAISELSPLLSRRRMPWL